MFYHATELISGRLEAVSMDITRRHALRMIPYLIKIMLGVFLIMEAKPIIKFIRDHQTSIETEE